MGSEMCIRDREGTRSLALLVHDPDAPTGGAGWWHWLVLNIPASATGLAKDAGKSDGSNLPPGAVQINTDFGAPGWGGPCPPVGDKPHRYVFTLYALTSPSGVLSSMSGKDAVATLDKTTGVTTRLTGTYERP